MTGVAMQSFGFGEQLVRAIDRGGVAWFVGNDVCAALALGNTSMALKRLEDDERDEVSIVDPIGRDQQTTIISESGVYALVFTSRKPAAKQFRRWVTQDVLPALRTRGEYRMPANDRATPRVVDLEGVLGTADDRHAIKTALLTVNTYKDLYGPQAGRDMLEKLGFPIPGVDLPAPIVATGASVSVPMVAREGDVHAWAVAVKLKDSKRDATSVSELYESYSRWCGATSTIVMHPRKFREMMVMLFGHEEHPEMIKVVLAR